MVAEQAKQANTQLPWMSRGRAQSRLLGGAFRLRASVAWSKSMSLQHKTETRARLNGFVYGALAHWMFCKGAAIVHEGAKHIVLCPQDGKHYHFMEANKKDARESVETWTLPCNC